MRNRNRDQLDRFTCHLSLKQTAYTESEKIADIEGRKDGTRTRETGPRSARDRVRVRRGYEQEADMRLTEVALICESPFLTPTTVT